jgi:arylsulfatase
MRSMPLIIGRFLLLLLFGSRLVAAEAPKPDILLLMPDQMRGDCLSILGHPAVATPHFDQLARQGVLFRRAYSTCPSCIPARYALLTGLFPATTGVVGYAAKPIVEPTLPQLLSKAGYSTALVGRYMHQVPASAPYGFQQERRGSVYVDDDNYDEFLRQVAPETGGIRSLVNKLGVSFNGWEAKPWPLADALHPVSWAISNAQQVLATVAVDKPVFLTASFFSPHPPLFPLPNYFERHLTNQLPIPAHGDWVDWASLSVKGDKAGHRVLLKDDALRAAQAGYFGAIDQLDAQLAPLIEAFKARSQKAHRPWLILLTSDHGEMLGDHGFFRKCEPYEGAANIPFIICGSPELNFQAGSQSRQPVCLEDLMPTLLQFSGVQCPTPIDGVSLVPLLRGAKIIVRQWLHSEHAPCYSKEQAFHALTDGHIKYIWRPENGAEQLFDLEIDPTETHDLARSTPHKAQLEECRSRLIKLLEGRPEQFTDGTKLIAGRPYPPIQLNKTASAAHPAGSK